jgi:hypothetical protein
MVTLAMRIQIMTVTGDSFSAQDSSCYEAKMKEIILIEQRPSSFADFREFEIDGKKYQMKHGTFRNNISRLKKRGEVELAFKSRPSFYTIPGRKFDKMMTLGRMGGARCNYRPISSKANHYL